jgi:hypothetical protein
MKVDGSHLAISIFPIKCTSLLSRHMCLLAGIFFSSTQQTHTLEMFMLRYLKSIAPLLIVQVWPLSFGRKIYMDKIRYCFPFSRGLQSAQRSKNVINLISPTITRACNCHFHRGHWVEDPLMIRPCYMPF